MRASTASRLGDEQNDDGEEAKSAKVAKKRAASR
jgi:hypothetical protein